MANHEKPIEFTNGLLDPSVVLEFMDDCHCDGLRPGRPINHKPEYHHLYFPAPDFTGLSVALTLRKLRNNPYNLVQMLSCQEDTYHQEVSKRVPLDQIDMDAAHMFGQEAAWLTQFAANSWLLADTKERIEFSDSGTPTKRALHAAAIELLEERLAASGEQVGRISVMHETVVNGALRRYLERTPEPATQAIVDSLGLGEPAVPVKIWHTERLETVARDRLKRKQNSLWWVLRKTLPKGIVVTPPALQTGVNAV